MRLDLSAQWASMYCLPMKVVNPQPQVSRIGRRVRCLGNDQCEIFSEIEGTGAGGVDKVKRGIIGSLASMTV